TLAHLRSTRARCRGCRLPNNFPLARIAPVRFDWCQTAASDQNFGCLERFFPISGRVGSKGADVSVGKSVLRPEIHNPIEQPLGWRGVPEWLLGWRGVAHAPNQGSDCSCPFA